MEPCTIREESSEPERYGRFRSIDNLPIHLPYLDIHGLRLPLRSKSQLNVRLLQHLKSILSNYRNHLNRLQYSYSIPYLVRYLIPLGDVIITGEDVETLDASRHLFRVSSLEIKYQTRDYKLQ